MRPFRRRPPEPGSAALLRPRLLAALLMRFEQRALTVVAPAGYGKTTLLAQAVSENALAPRGADVWLTCEPADSDDSALVASLATALGHEREGGDLDAVIDGVWQRSPLPVVLLLDDVHEIAGGSEGAAALAELLVALPENGHVVMAGRHAPAVPVARLVAEGRATLVDHDDLLLSSDEQTELATMLGVSPALLARTGGWPALAQLTATAGRALAERYVWEEVLTALGPAARRVLAHLVAVGGADASLAAAVLGEEVDIDALLATAPLVARRPGEHGYWYVPHDLWAPILAADLDPAAAAAARRHAAAILRSRGELQRAGELLLADPVDDAGWPELASLIVEASALIPSLSGAGPAEAWLAAIPASRRAEPESRLLTGVVARTYGHAGRARDELRAAADGARACGAVDAELAALGQLAHIAWWSDDLMLLAEVLARGRAADAAAPLAVLGTALAADTAHDPAESLRVLDGFVSNSPELNAAADFLRGRALLALGRAADAIAVADRAAAASRPPLPAAQIQTFISRWQAGRPHEVVDHLEAMIPGPSALPRDRLLTNLNLAYAFAQLGQVDKAEACLADARAHSQAVEGSRIALLATTVTAVVAAAGGDQETARELVAGVDTGFATLAALRALLPAVYVLNPDVRAPWDAEELGPDHDHARQVARALVDARAGPNRASRVGGQVRQSPERVLVTLGFRWGIELAARTHDEALASYILSVCGGPARAVLRALAPQLDGGRRLLRTLPSPPTGDLRIRTLGALALVRSGDEVHHPDWRRERVRSLLCLLVARRRVTRSEAAAALWPELDEVASAANMRTTLNYLHRVLEPERQVGDATFRVRVEGDGLRLEPEYLLVDAWELETHLAEAAAAESAGSPSLALQAYEKALALWQGEYLHGIYDDWALPERDRLRARFLAALVRAGELLLAKGDLDRALALATRGIETEPWAEGAHRLVIAAHLARGDRASARRALERCHDALAELGVAPMVETEMVARTVLGVAG